MRRLAIDLTYQPTGGTLNQIIQIIENIESYNFDEVIFYTSYDNLHLFPNKFNNIISLKKLNFSKKSIILRAIWAQLILPFLLIFDKVDVLFCPGNLSPIINTKKKVQWIHTIGPFEKKFISSYQFKEKFILIVTKYLMIFSSHTSDMVIFESNYTRDLFINKFKQKIDKSIVIHSGNDDFFRPIKASKSNFVNVNVNVNIIESRNFIFTVSHLYPYKNLELLIESYYNLGLYKKELYILVAGSFSDQKYYEKLQLKLANYSISKYVIFLGRLEKADLRELYSLCKIFIFTSPFENFAYTLIEAMNCGAPIITTNTTSMPEACGNAALYFHPNSEIELSKRIMSFLNDENMRLKFKKMSLLKTKDYPVHSVVNNKTKLLLHQLVET